MVIFPNYESRVERDDIKEPFTEVSMFKRNYDHLPNDTYFGMYKESTRGNPNYFLTCGNGKSVAPIQDHLRPNGAHGWHNYMKTPKYHEHVVWGDKDLKMKLLRKGILTRIYAPMVIIQGFTGIRCVQICDCISPNDSF